MSEETYPLIHMVGVEMEGGWRNRVFLDAEIHDDISVPPPEGYGPMDHWGEIASEPLHPSLAEEWMKKHYPLDIPPAADGKSCGLHFHISTLCDGDYNKLLSQTFYDAYLKHINAKVLGEMDQGHPDYYNLSMRLMGQNRFARRLYAPSRQVWCKEKDSGRDAERRTLINYCHGLHGTVEFRLFPMFTEQKHAVHALRETLGMVNRFLAERVGKHDRGSLRKAWVGDLLSAVR